MLLQVSGNVSELLQPTNVDISSHPEVEGVTISLKQEASPRTSMSPLAEVNDCHSVAQLVCASPSTPPGHEHRQRQWCWHPVAVSGVLVDISSHREGGV